MTSFLQVWTRVATRDISRVNAEVCCGNNNFHEMSHGISSR